MSDEPANDATPRQPKKLGELVPQKHGGALKHGGSHARAGRPRGQVRADLLKELDECRHILKKIALSTAKKTRDADRIRAIEVMGRLAMDAAVRIDDVRECLREQSRIFYERLPEEKADEILGAIRPVWLKL